MSRIYIVDDDRDIVESLTIVLTKEGHEVTSQHDELNVADNAVQFRPELIILDVMFPENASAGFEVARALKKDDRTKNIPILMLSAVNDKGMIPGKLSSKDRDDTWLPVHEFVEKPIDPQTLIKKVNALLGA